jgi:hypothetical protein
LIDYVNAGGNVYVFSGGDTDANGCYDFDNAVSGKPFDVLIKGPVVP